MIELWLGRGDKGINCRVGFDLISGFDKIIFSWKLSQISEDTIYKIRLSQEIDCHVCCPLIEI